MQFGICISKAEDIAAVNAAGFDYFEFAACSAAAMSEQDFALLCRRADAEGLPCLGFNAYSSGKPKLVGPDYSAEAVRNYAQLVCQRGAALGIKCIGIGAPKARQPPSGYGRAEADRQFAEFLCLTAECAAEYGICVLLEAIWSGMCPYINRSSEAVRTVKQISAENIGIVLDFYHSECEGESLSVLDEVAPYLLHTHISSRGRGLARGIPQAEDEGKYTHIISALRAHSYDGSMSIEPDCFEYSAAAAGLEMLRRAEAPQQI